VVELSDGSKCYAKKHPKLSLVSLQVVNDHQDLLRKPSPLPGYIWEATWRLISAVLSFLHSDRHFGHLVKTGEINCLHYMAG
jgi:hypothetical protein